MKHTDNLLWKKGEQMRVLMFGWEFPPFASGGLGTSCYGLTRHMALRDVEIKFVVPKVRGQMFHYFLEIVDGEKVVTDDLRKEVLKNDSYEHLKEYLKADILLNPYFSESTYKETLEKLKKEQESISSQTPMGRSFFFSGDYGESLLEEVERYALVGKSIAKSGDFDLIHAHDWMSILAAVEAKKESGKPMVYHVHSTEYDRNPGKMNKRVMEIEKYGLEQADRIIAVSQRTKNMLVENYGISGDKIDVIYNAVEKGDTIEFDKKVEHLKDKKIVLFLGRITSQKGPEFFIKAAKKVIEHVPNVCFIMAGDGDMAAHIMKEVQILGLSEYFHFTGFLRTPEREKLYAISDVYVMPSVSEPFGITPLEVMRYDVPIIISNQSGVAEILDHVAKVDFWDVDETARLIVTYLTDDNLRQQMVRNYGKALDKVDWKMTAQKVCQLYQEKFGLT